MKAILVIWTPLFLSVFLLSFASCSFQNTKPESSVLRVQLSAEPISLDPSLAEDGVSLRVIHNFMEGLVGYDGAGELRMRLAESFDLSKDARVFRFTLRDKIFWSDGTPVVAEDFVRGLRHSLAPQTPSKLAELLRPIEGADGFRTGRSQELGVRAIGDRIVEIRLSRPALYFPHALTLPTAMPRKEKFSIQVGTGPFILSEHLPKQRIRLTRNPYYYEPVDSRAFQEVLFQYVEDESTGVNLFRKGRLDLLSRVPVLDLQSLRQDHPLTISPFLATYYLGFRVDQKPFNQIKLRKAIAGAIDRNAILSILGSGETPAWSWVPVGMEGYRSQPGAADFKKEMKWVLQLKNKPKLSILYSADHRNELILQKIQNDLKERLGLELELLPSDWKTFVRSLSEKPGFFRFGWLAAFHDPISHLEVFLKDNPNNHTGWSDPRYEKWVSEIRALKPGSPERLKRIEKAERLLLEDQAVIIPIYHYVQTYAVSKRIESFRVNPFGVILLNELRYRD